MKTLGYQVGGNHYQRFEVQPLEFIRRNRLSFLVGNVIKYVCRADVKGGLEDLRKARHYLECLVEDAGGTPEPEPSRDTPEPSRDAGSQRENAFLLEWDGAELTPDDVFELLHKADEDAARVVVYDLQKASVVSMLKRCRTAGEERVAIADVAKLLQVDPETFEPVRKTFRTEELAPNENEVIERALKTTLYDFPSAKPPADMKPAAEFVRVDEDLEPTAARMLRIGSGPGASGYWAMRRDVDGRSHVAGVGPGTMASDTVPCGLELRLVTDPSKHCDSCGFKAGLHRSWYGHRTPKPGAGAGVVIQLPKPCDQTLRLAGRPTTECDSCGWQAVEHPNWIHRNEETTK